VWLCGERVKKVTTSSRGWPVSNETEKSYRQQQMAQ
jgi:hypothetical protein